MNMQAPGIVGIKPVLITGGAGFIGSNLADRIASEGEHVLVLDALRRPGVERNVDWLMTRHRGRVSLLTADVRDTDAVARAAREASAVYHFAAQVAVTTSMVAPLEDFSINLRGTIELLEALRQRTSPPPLVFASTNKVYGDLADLPLVCVDDAWVPVDAALRASGVGEDRPLDFHTPYGCSKGGADQYVLDYARSFGIPATVMRMSCIYGPRQMGTEDQGWVAHFLLRALRGEPLTIYGDGRQVRDLLFVDDVVRAYVQARRRISVCRGHPYNLGGGPGNAVSLIQLVAFMEKLLGRRVPVRFDDWRAGDQRYYVSDTRRASRDLGLPPPVAWRTGVARLARWLEEEQALQRAVAIPERVSIGASA